MKVFRPFFNTQDAESLSCPELCLLVNTLILMIRMENQRK